MRIFAGIVFCVLATAPSPVRAADPSEVFSTILGEIGRQIERQQREKQLKRLRPLWDACAGGDITACDRAAALPGLDDQARAELERMRQAAERRAGYERNFFACQNLDSSACEAALANPNLSHADRVVLQNWAREAEQRLRAQLLAAERERQAAEQRRQAARADLHQDQRNCYAGLITACTAAISNALASAGERRNLEVQRSRLQRAERQRQAAIREYAALKRTCADGQRAACTLAMRHALVRSSDVAFLQQRDRELAPLSERITNLFAKATPGSRTDAGASSIVGVAVLGALALLGVGLSAFYVVFNRSTASPARPEPPPLEPDSLAGQPFGVTTPENFPLTGHMPTDVRRALLGANP